MSANVVFLHISCILTTCFNFCSGFSFYFFLFTCSEFFLLNSFLFSCLNFQYYFPFLFLFNFYSDLNYCFNFHPDLLFSISIFIVLIPILMSGLKFHSNKFDCLNLVSYFLVKFLNNFYFSVKVARQKPRPLDMEEIPSAKGIICNQ